MAAELSTSMPTCRRLLAFACGAALFSVATPVASQEQPSIWNGAALHLQIDGIGATGSFYDPDAVSADGTLSATALVAAGPDATMARGFGLGVGFDKQMGETVLGALIDLSRTSLESDVTLTDAASATTMSSRAAVDWVTTLRGRIGKASGHWLIYGVGGLAFAAADVATRRDVFDPGSGATLTDTDNGREPLIGAALGAGVELASLSTPFSARLEYQYVNFRDVDLAAGLGGGASAPFDASYHTLRVGIGLRF